MYYEELQLSVKILVNRSEHKDLDEAVYKWFCEMRNPCFRCKPLLIARSHIQARVILEADQRGIAGLKLLMAGLETGANVAELVRMLDCSVKLEMLTHRFCYERATKGFVCF